jgi:TetR/AcrR family transcriptional repressor of bet genes
MADETPRYRRIKPALRREHLIAATLACLAAYGADGASIRRIAAEAGVSTGLINHHYTHLEDLVAEAYDTLASEILRQILAKVAETEPDPRARISAFFAVSFSPTVLNPGHMTAWLVFWSMIQHSVPMRAVHERTNEEYRQALETLLVALAAQPGHAAEMDVRLAAAGLSALLDGLWLSWGLNPDKFSPAEGIEICEAWIEHRWPCPRR